MGNCTSLELETLTMNGMPVAVWLLKHYNADRETYDNIMTSFLAEFKNSSPKNNK